MSSRPLSSLYPRALVTGASSGLGRAFAQMLLSEGVEVWGSSRDVARLEPFAALSRTGQRFHPVQCDLCDEAGAMSALAAAEAEAGGGFDLVVLNAGLGVFGAFDALPYETWRAQVSAMVLGQAALAHRCYGRMRADGRHAALVIVGSMAAEFPIPFMTGYNMAKAAQAALAASLVDEALGSPVVVLEFRPADYRTGFNRSVLRRENAPEREVQIWERLEEELKRAPLPGRAATDLRRALLRGRRGVVRSGGFFQVHLARLAALLLPASWMGFLRRRHFGLRAS